MNYYKTKKNIYIDINSSYTFFTHDDLYHIKLDRER